MSDAVTGAPAPLFGYMAESPRGARILLQEYLPDEGEAGISYLLGSCREQELRAGQSASTVFASAGRRPQHHRAIDGAAPASRMHRRDGACEATCDPSGVPSSGERVRLPAVSSSRVRGIYLDGNWAITPELTPAIDAFARDMRDFPLGSSGSRRPHSEMTSRQPEREALRLESGTDRPRVTFTGRQLNVGEQ